jgi:hypothetical protein
MADLALYYHSLELIWSMFIIDFCSDACRQWGNTSQHFAAAVPQAASWDEFPEI